MSSFIIAQWRLTCAGPVQVDRHYAMLRTCTSLHLQWGSPMLAKEVDESAARVSDAACCHILRANRAVLLARVVSTSAWCEVLLGMHVLT